MEHIGEQAYLIHFDQQVQKGSIELLEFTKKEALNRSLKVLAGCYIGAIITLFIPIVHFIATPALVVLGPVISRVMYKFFNGQKSLKATRIKCSNCQSEFELPQSPSSWPFFEKCSNCQAEIKGEFVSSDK